MFGFFKTHPSAPKHSEALKQKELQLEPDTYKSEALRLNALNPRCAIAFHPLFDTALGKRPYEQSVFEFCKGFESDFRSCRSAKTQLGLDRATANVMSHLVGWIHSEKVQEEKKRSTPDQTRMFGGYTVLVPLGRLVFGIAPGLASNGPGEAQEITRRAVEAIKLSFEKHARSSPFDRGVCEVCSLFLSTLDDLALEPLSVILNELAKLANGTRRDKTTSEQKEDKIIIPCPQCKGRVRLPKGKHLIEVRCPHCVAVFRMET